jgi:hypothetical protein
MRAQKIEELLDRLGRAGVQVHVRDEKSTHFGDWIESAGGGVKGFAAGVGAAD